MAAKTPPSIEPTNRLGAKIPPDPPEETVRDSASILAMTRVRSSPRANRPSIAS